MRMIEEYRLCRHCLHFKAGLHPEHPDKHAFFCRLETCLAEEVLQELEEMANSGLEFAEKLLPKYKLMSKAELVWQRERSDLELADTLSMTDEELEKSLAEFQHYFDTDEQYQEALKKYGNHRFVKEH